MSKVVVSDGRKTVQDGKDTEFRCFSASQEVVYGTVYDQRKYNFDLLRQTEDKAGLISESLPDCDIVRVHVGGDFFSLDYFNAWMDVARNFQDRLFYAYTKSLPYWIKSDIPDNFKLNASKGGKRDWLIEPCNLKFAEVVFSEQEAEEKELEIDHDDSLAFKQDSNFGLLIHGIQPANTKASKAWQIVRKAGKEFGKKAA